MAKNNIVFSMLLNNTDFVKKMGMSWKETKQFEKRVNGATSSLKQMAMGGLAPMLGKLTAFAGGAALVGGALSRATEKMMALDTALAEMKALLGASADQMARFKTAAINMASKSSVAADEVVRAMIKVGGAMPQLLGFEDGLKSVTQSAITLSEASGMSLEESINSLTGLMNQFGASAMDSDRYINALAAASQAGSAEIDYLAEAVAKSGGAATSANIEFEELVALIEAVAPKFGKAEEAGTALRGVLLKMETSGTRTKISTQGLSKAIDQLARMSPDELVKQFGVQGFNMAKAMVDAKDAFEKFNKEVRDTNAAEEQAKIRADNLKGAIDILANKWDAFTLSVNNSCGPLKDVVDLLSSALDIVTRLNPTYDSFINKKKDENTKKAKEDAPQILKKYSKDGVSEADALNAAIAEVEMRLGMAEAKQKLLNLNRPKEDYDNLPDVSDISATQKMQGLSAGIMARIVSGAQKVESVVSPEEHRKRREAQLEDYEKNELDIDYLSKILSFLKDKAKGSPSRQVTVEGGGEGSSEAKVSNPLSAVEGDLRAMGIDTDALKQQITHIEDLKKGIQELNTAINVTGNNPELQERLIALRDNFQSVVDSAENLKKPSGKTVIAGLDVTELSKTRDKVKELESEISQLEDLLKLDPSNAKLLITLSQLKTQLMTLKPAMAAIKQPTYTNPWEQNYRDNWKNGNSNQKIDFASEAADTVLNGINSVGNLLSDLGLEEAGEAIGQVTGVISDVIGVIQAVSSIIQMVQGVSMGQNTFALHANTFALDSLAASLVFNSGTNMVPFFSEGGVIGGSSWTGDKLLARVNSGELVLNAKQQKNLLAGLNNVGGVETVGGSSKTLIRGEDLWVAIDNFQRRTKRRL